MRVLLLEAPLFHGDGSGRSCPLVPLGLASLNATLRPAHETALLVPDLAATPRTGLAALEQLVERILNWRPALVGLSATSATYRNAVQLARRLRAREPALPLLLGGVHASCLPAATAAEGSFTGVVAGEADRLLPELADQLARTGELPPGRFPGLWLHDAGSPIPPPAPLPLPSVTTLPLPCRDGLLLEQPLPPSAYGSLITSRGCCFSCSYCAAPTLSERRVRSRPVGQVLEELDLLLTRYAVPSLFFQDSSFTVPRHHFKELTTALAARTPPIPYTCQTRIDQLDPESMDLLAASGCNQLMLGLETGAPRTAARIGKQAAPEQIRRGVDGLRARGINSAGFFMIGFPWETEEELEQTATLATQLGLDTLHLFSACPLPGTALWEETGGFDLQGSFDFRTPWRNFTGLPEATYRERFLNVAARFEAYNVARMLARWTRPAGPSPEPPPVVVPALECPLPDRLAEQAAAPACTPGCPSPEEPC